MSRTQKTASEVAERARDGDSSAITSIFETHRSRVRALLTRMLDPRLNARVGVSDVLQDVYLDFHQQIEAFLRQPRVPLYVWLRGVAVQRLTKVHRAHLRAARRSLASEYRLSDPSPTAPIRQLAAPDPSPSERIVKRELQNQVRAALSRLKPADRDIIVWRQYDGKSNSEVARNLGISDSAATMRYARALTRLQALLKPAAVGNGSTA